MDKKNRVVCKTTPSINAVTNLSNVQCKGTKKIGSQLNMVWNSFYSEPKTMMQCAIQTGLDRGNVCWLVRELRLSHRIQAIKRAHCPITNFLAFFWTTNPSLFLPEPVQLELFPEFVEGGSYE